VIAPVISLAIARAKSLARSVDTGIMSACAEAGRVHFRFNKSVSQFQLSPRQARFWARTLLTLADAAERGE
jgi:hypothetical protein